jgi:hypothetical protein
VEIIKLFPIPHASGPDPSQDTCTEISRILSKSIFIYIHLTESLHTFQKICIHLPENAGYNINHHSMKEREFWVELTKPALLLQTFSPTKSG